MAVTTVNPVVD